MSYGHVPQIPRFEVLGLFVDDAVDKGIPGIAVGEPALGYIGVSEITALQVQLLIDDASKPVIMQGNVGQRLSRLN
jgi:hypothetical protein